MSRLIGMIEALRGYDARSCIEEATGSCHTFGDLLREIEHWQARLAERSVVAGAVVGLRADFSLAAIAALFALLATRASVAMIPRGCDPSGHLRDSHASIWLDFDAEGSHQWHDAPSPANHPLIERLRATTDCGLIIFTSGSTGRPKAALHSVERFLHKYDKPGRCMRTLAFLLFDHVAGLDTLFYTLRAGGTLVLTQRRDPQSIVRLVSSHRIEVLPTSPSFLRALCMFEEHARYTLSSIRVITYGSEPMDATTLARLNARFPNADIIQKYGTTETGSPRTISRGNDSLWLKMRGGATQTKIVDGILWMRSPGTILGYLNAPSPFDADGWYCTGDLVEVDGEWLRFRGRATDIINVGGEKVAPAEVEQVVLELDIVRDVVVSGQAHALMGQVVTARVVLAKGDLDPREAQKLIRAHCRQRLPSHKVPMQITLATSGLVTERQKAWRGQAPAS